LVLDGVTPVGVYTLQAVGEVAGDQGGKMRLEAGFSSMCVVERFVNEQLPIVC
jgi:hypothetical protein